jgi:hypothetical protein
VANSFLFPEIWATSDHFWFGSVFIKKNNQTETGSNRQVSVQFFQDKNRFNLVWLGFFVLTRFFAGLAQFFFVWVRFGSVFSVLDL